MNPLLSAIQMELDGEKYYTGQAVLHNGDSLHTVFLMLANDEKAHASLLQSRLNGGVYDINDSQPEGLQSLFKDLKDFKMDIKKFPDQLDVYREAQAQEKESILLYKDLLSKSSAESDTELFAFLVKQEENHFAVLEELVILLSRPNEWVESAEFGVRQEY